MEHRQRKMHLLGWKIMAIVLPVILLAVVVLRPVPILKAPEQISAPVDGAK